MLFLYQGYTWDVCRGVYWLGGAGLLGLRDSYWGLTGIVVVADG